MLRLTLAAAVLLTAAPALAAPEHASGSSDPRVAAGCIKQQVHAPAGKIVTHAPVYFCKTKAQTIAANDKLRPYPAATAAGRD